MSLADSSDEDEAVQQHDERRPSSGAGDRYSASAASSAHQDSKASASSLSHSHSSSQFAESTSSRIEQVMRAKGWKAPL